MLNKYRKYINRFLDRIVLPLGEKGLKPWIISSLGLILTITGTILIIINYTRTSLNLFIILISLGTFMDALDGALARHQKKESSWGAFYDAFFDRITEISIIIGLLYTNILSPLTSYLYITTSLIISYIRAKGESLKVNLKGIGLMERAERIIILIISLALWSLYTYDLNIIIYILIILNSLTIIQRTAHVYRTLER